MIKTPSDVSQIRHFGYSYFSNLPDFWCENSIILYFFIKIIVLIKYDDSMGEFSGAIAICYEAKSARFFLSTIYECEYCGVVMATHWGQHVLFLSLRLQLVVRKENNFWDLSVS